MASPIHFQKQSGIKGKFKSFEFMDLLLKQSSTSLRVVIVYRPQTMDNNKSSTSLFFEEFSKLLEALTTAPGSLLMAGDFNFHVEVPSDCDAQRFLRLLETFNLIQHINVLSRRSVTPRDLSNTGSPAGFPKTRAKKWGGMLRIKSAMLSLCLCECGPHSPIATW